MSRQGRYVRTQGGSFRDRTTGKFVSRQAWERERESLRKAVAPVRRILEAPPKKPRHVEVLPGEPMRRAPSGVLEPVPMPMVRPKRSIKGKYVKTPSGAVRDRKTGRFVPKEKWEREREKLRKPVPLWAPERPKAPPKKPKAPPRVSPEAPAPVAPPREVVAPPEEMDWPDEEVEVFEVDDEDYDSD